MKGGLLRMLIILFYVKFEVLRFWGKCGIWVVMEEDFFSKCNWIGWLKKISISIINFFSKVLGFGNSDIERCICFLSVEEI